MRPDLQALTPEALAVLANRGLVKRAQKLIAKGQGPTCTLNGDVVVGTFPDGTVTELPPDVPLVDAPCSCGAMSVCRHRLATVLAAREAEAPAAREAWNPGRWK